MFSRLFRRPIIEASLKGVEIVDYPQGSEQLETFRAHRTTLAQKDAVDDWVAYHKRLRSTLEELGMVETNFKASRGFYHTRNWHHPLDDSFAVMNAKVFKRGLLNRVRSTVRSQGVTATAALMGDTPVSEAVWGSNSLDGLQILFFGDTVFIEWFQCDRKQRIEALQGKGIVVELDGKVNG